MAREDISPSFYISVIYNTITVWKARLLSGETHWTNNPKRRFRKRIPTHCLWRRVQRPDFDVPIHSQRLSFGLACVLLRSEAQDSRSNLYAPDHQGRLKSGLVRIHLRIYAKNVGEGMGRYSSTQVEAVERKPQKRLQPSHYLDFKTGEGNKQTKTNRKKFERWLGLDTSITGADTYLSKPVSFVSFVTYNQ
ncbi:uncharacterized protein LOC103161649 isoform X1 [Cricetulus griseus]|uniref:uncharacterized protein LOC103161649 isoform X1 n=1 Tax=Cricetulus griseus TaxID=10029 RepID=UPI000F73DF7E|nr:uncharacterized protein LOC103161649 isoform X1 [Cricetulus griseus]